MRYNLTTIVAGQEYAISDQMYGYGSFSGNIVKATALTPIVETHSWGTEIISWKFRRDDNKKVIRRSSRGIKNLWSEEATRIEQMNAAAEVRKIRITPVVESSQVLEDMFKEMGIITYPDHRAYEYHGNKVPTITIHDISHETAFVIVEALKAANIKSLKPMFPVVKDE